MLEHLHENSFFNQWRKCKLIYLLIDHLNRNNSIFFSSISLYYNYILFFWNVFEYNILFFSDIYKCLAKIYNWGSELNEVFCNYLTILWFFSKLVKCIRIYFV